MQGLRSVFLRRDWHVRDSRADGGVRFYGALTGLCLLGLLAAVLLGGSPAPEKGAAPGTTVAR